MLCAASEPHRRGNEALHHVALGREDISLVDIDAALFQAFLETRQLPVLRAVKPHHRPMLEVAQFERAQIEGRFAAQDGFRSLAVIGRDEGHRRLRTQAHVPGPAVCCQPETHLRAGGRIPPVSGQNETLFKLSQTSTSKRASSPGSILPLCALGRAPAVFVAATGGGFVRATRLDADAPRSLYHRFAAIPSAQAMRRSSLPRTE